MNCSLCDIDVPQERIDEGYTICVKCSTEEKVSCHTIYPHKTGGYIQVVSKEQSKNLNRLDRRGTSTKTARHYKEFKVDTIDEPKPIKRYRCNKTYTSFDTALKMVMDYYDEWGYEPTIRYLKELNSKGDIALKQRAEIQDLVVERCLEPSPRALQRRYGYNR